MLVREKCKRAQYVIVVEMNMGQVLQSVRMSLERPERVFLANRVDGTLITPLDIRNVLRLVQGKGV
jgi:2-oxoglutarate ferredoxin oxidoreductase subunit alpha